MASGRDTATECQPDSEDASKETSDSDEQKLAAERTELEAYCLELASRQRELRELAEANEDPSKSPYPPFAKSDSNLKKNTAFVKKLKSYSDSQRDSVLKEMQTLNLSKYLEEVANSLLEAKLRSGDVGGLVMTNSLLHRNYAGYGELALAAWRKALPHERGSSTASESLNLSKLRVDLRLFGDLVLAKALPQQAALKLLYQTLANLLANDAEFGRCGVVCHFLELAGDDFVGEAPAARLLAAERLGVKLPRSDLLPPEPRRHIRRLLAEYHRRLVAALTEKHSELVAHSRTSRKILQSKGEISQERADAADAMRKEFERLMANATKLGNLVNEPTPDLSAEPVDELDDERSGVDLDSLTPDQRLLEAAVDFDAAEARFEDEDSRQFYELLPDLRPMLPELLLRDAKAAAAAKEAEKLANDESAAKETEVDEELLEQELLAEEAKAQSEAEQAEALPAVDEEPQQQGAGVGADEEASAPQKVVLDQFLSTLPNLVNRDLIDKAALEFATSFNTKGNRRKLAQQLCSVHRSRYDLLPFYSRLAAVLSPIAPELSDELCRRLQSEFRHLFRKKDQTNIESKLKVVRFIGELVKFGLFPTVDALNDLKVLIINFSLHSVEMACAMLETCGRFLYRTKETHLRVKVYLRNLWNKKTKIVHDDRTAAMIENAYYSVIPPDTSKLAKAVQLTPMQMFIQKLLFKELCNATVEKVLRLSLRLPWDEPETEEFIVQCFSSVWCVQYSAIHCLASVLAGLAPYHQSAAVAVVDNLLEDMRVCMELNRQRHNQRRVAGARYLGELYNYCIVESGVVFNALYSFVTFGVAAMADGEPDSELDPPEHLLRIRLACVVLDTCGQYFDRGSNKRKLDAFLLYLQQYYWFKRQHSVWSGDERPFPLDIEYLFLETVEKLRPKFKFAQSFDEAKAAVAKQEKVFQAKLEKIAARLQADSALNAINEETEEGGESGGGGGGGSDEAGGDTSADEEARAGQKRRGGGTSQSLSEGDDDDDEEKEEEEREQEEEEESSMRQRQPRRIECPEDDEFVQQFEKMLADQAATAPATAPAAELTLPPQQQQQQEGKLAFTVLARRGQSAKQPVVQLDVDSRLAQRYLREQEAARLEREMVKQATLSITEAQMMEEAGPEAAGCEWRQEQQQLLQPQQQRRYGARGGRGGRGHQQQMFQFNRHH